MKIDKSKHNELLIGAGSSRIKKVHCGNYQWENLTTLDINPDHKPDVVHDLEELPLPFEDESFDEILAFEVLEHIGKLGDYKFFFNQWTDFYRLLKPNGIFVGSCPLWNNIWCFGDPSHSRVIQKENFHFLCQPNYTNEVGRTAMSDFRYIYKSDFNLTYYKENGTTFQFILQAIKPSRYVPLSEPK